MFARLNQWFQRHFSDPQVAILALFLVLGVLAFVVFGRMLAPVFAALVLAYLLEGAVLRLERMGANRLLSVIGVFSGFMAVLFYLIFGLVPMVSRQLAAIVRDLPSYIAMAPAWVAPRPDRLPPPGAPSPGDALADATKDKREWLARRPPQELDL